MGLNTNPDMVKVMEDDLRAKVQLAIDCNPDLRMAVYGVFSVDDLEARMESDLGGMVGVGVQYAGCTKQSKDKEGTFAAAGGNTARGAIFKFHTILAVPSTDHSDERHNATKLLSVLRLAILGKSIDGERTNRPWDFVEEAPVPSASSTSMMYYAQVWQVAVQHLGTAG